MSKVREVYLRIVALGDLGEDDIFVRQLMQIADFEAEHDCALCRVKIDLLAALLDQMERDKLVVNFVMPRLTQ